MANRDTAMGFRVAQGIGSQHVFKMFPVDASSSTATYVGDMMDLNAAGSVRPAAADAGISVAGVCVAVYDSNGVPCGAPNSSVSTKYLTGSVAGYALVALAIPGVVFIGQLDSGTTPTSADIGATCDHVAGVGSTTTARSAHELDASNIGTGLQVRIFGKVEEPNNSWAEHVDAYFMFNESAFGCSAAATV